MFFFRESKTASLHIVRGKKFWELTAFCQQFVNLFLVFEFKLFVHKYRIDGANITIISNIWTIFRKIFVPMYQYDDTCLILIKRQEAPNGMFEAS